MVRFVLHTFQTILRRKKNLKEKKTFKKMLEFFFEKPGRVYCWNAVDANLLRLGIPNKIPKIFLCVFDADLLPTLYASYL